MSYARGSRVRCRLCRPEVSRQFWHSGFQSPWSIAARAYGLLLRRSAPVANRLRGIFRGQGVPVEMIYVGLVESGYRTDAVSSAGAVGPWQFMFETARRYGLRQWKGVDERRELEKSTRAAARYLRDLYELLGDWTLAIAGYNAGEYRVLRAMQESGGKDFWSLRHLLPRETAEYVPRVLAAIQMAQSSS